LREIGSITQERDAKVLADYLLTLKITTKLESRAGNWVVWVHREERVPEARAALAEFQLNPADPRFHAAAQTAKVIRKQNEKVERDYRRRVRDFRERWEGAMYHRAPFAFGLIVISVVVFALEYVLGDQIFDRLAFSYQYYDQEGVFHDTGFDMIRRGQVWRLITPIFLHFGPVHLIFNMMAMRYLGERVEMRKGLWRFALIVVVGAIAGNVGQFYSSGGGFGGMSGVVYALAGYLWVKGNIDPEDHLSLSPRSVNWMVAWFLLGILAPLGAGPDTPHVFPYNMANVAHGVGLASGMVFGILKF
jgi:GlpG protein